MHRRIGAVLAVVILTMVTFLGLDRAFRNDVRPAAEPTTGASFGKVRGWVAYSTDEMFTTSPFPVGIWAADPMRPTDHQGVVLLSKRPGSPVAWSSDGSELLIWRKHRGTSLSVLRSDGSETEVLHSRWRSPFRHIPRFASFSGDGSRVIFAGSEGIYSVDLAGGTPSLIRRAERWVPGWSGRAVLSNPAVSPDGTQIAYFDVWPHSAESIRVMNADGSGVRVLVNLKPTHCVDTTSLAWSPDAKRLAFECANGVWEVGADGVGLTRVIVGNWRQCDYGHSLSWSPDGTRIAFVPCDTTVLTIADAGGSHSQTVWAIAASSAWNPL